MASGKSGKVTEGVASVVKPLEDLVTIDTNKTAYLIHGLVNEERAKYNIRPLKYDERLASVALAHSQDMIARDFYDHDNPDGEDPSDRTRKAGYSCTKATHIGIAENITQGGSRFGDYTEEQVARAAVKGWMESEGHRFNILDFRYDREGIGLAFNNLGNFAYITQNFC
jgi:uncharacterized protein YkwD